MQRFSPPSGHGALDAGASKECVTREPFRRMQDPADYLRIKCTHRIPKLGAPVKKIANGPTDRRRLQRSSR